PGLSLDQEIQHKHMQLHPALAGLIIEIGRDYGMKAMRIPAEPVAVLRRAFPSEHYRTSPYGLWVKGLRRRLRRAGLYATDYVFGVAWSGAMVEERVLGLVPHLPE